MALSDPRVRELAVSYCLGLAPNDELGEMRAVFNGALRDFRFIKDPDRLAASPAARRHCGHSQRQLRIPESRSLTFLARVPLVIPAVRLPSRPILTGPANSPTSTLRRKPATGSGSRSISRGATLNSAWRQKPIDIGPSSDGHSPEGQAPAGWQACRIFFFGEAGHAPIWHGRNAHG